MFNFFKKKIEEKEKVFVHIPSPRRYVKDEKIIIIREKIFWIDF